ncbi:hypothetical protein Mapa_005698 [Marchantia paleacea]|nr:hypothetical protein Mapa_005698 [Marchantia paleacea]
MWGSNLVKCMKKHSITVIFLVKVGLKVVHVNLISVQSSISIWQVWCVKCQV